MNSSINNSIHALGQDSFKWWFGSVEQTDNPDSNPELGKVRVRIIGYHTTDKKILPDDKLPWAVVLQPTTSASVNKKGQSGNGLRPGSFVVGFFIDGDESQQPIVIGSLFSELLIDPEVNMSEETSIGYPNVVTSVPDTKKPPDQPNASKASASNPTGDSSRNRTANGADGPGRKFMEEIRNALQRLVETFRYVTTYEYESQLIEDINDTQQHIRIDNENFPPNGIIKINDELIGYTEKNKNLLLESSRGAYGTKPTNHKKGSIVKHEDGEFNAGKLISTITGKVINVRKEIDRVLNIIRNLVTWLVNTIKSYLLGLISQLLQSILSAIKSAIPFNVQIIAEAILRIMNQIGCTFDTSLVDSIMNNIQNAIENVINSILKNITDFLDKINSCVNDIFDNIMSITSLISGVIRLIEGVSKIFKGISTGDMIVDGKLNITKINSISNIVVFLLKLLGIGCGDKLKNEFDIEWSTYNCDTSSEQICGDFRISKILRGLWAPLYPYNTVINYGSGIFSERDITPGSSRTVDSYGKGTLDFTDNDGNRVIVINGNSSRVVWDDDNILIKGNCNLTIDGNYKLLVKGDYDLEVTGNMKMNIGNKSQFIFTGEHNTEYKLDSTLSAVNGLALTASQLGLGASGIVKIYSGVYSIFTNEINQITLGSNNEFQLYGNKFTTFDINELTGRNVYGLIGGNNVELTTANSIKVIGNTITTTAGSDHTLIVGGSSFNSTALSYTLFSGANFNQYTEENNNHITNGIYNQITNGISNENTLGIEFKLLEGSNYTVSPFTIIGS